MTGGFDPRMPIPPRDPPPRPHHPALYDDAAHDQLPWARRALLRTSTWVLAAALLALALVLLASR
jgi:hypothetical protein